MRRMPSGVVEAVGGTRRLRDIVGVGGTLVSRAPKMTYGRKASGARARGGNGKESAKVEPQTMSSCAGEVLLLEWEGLREQES
jgi:hypothetical protein